MFSNPLDIEAILSSIDFRRERISASVNSSAKRVWRQILLVLQHGEIVDGNFLLLSAAIRSYPDNPVFRRLAETYLRALRRQDGRQLAAEVIDRYPGELAGTDARSRATG